MNRITRDAQTSAPPAIGLLTPPLRGTLVKFAGHRRRASLGVGGGTAGVLPTVHFDGVRLHGNILTWDALDGNPAVTADWRPRSF